MTASAKGPITGAISVRRQFTHDAWADLKTANSRRCIPLAKELVGQLRLHRLRTPGELVFPGPSGQPIDYHNRRARVWAPLLKRTGVSGTFHMLRHFFVTALIQSGVNAKVAQTLAGHHSASFTLDQYADAVPQQLEEAGEKVATLLLEASGSILVAGAQQPEVRKAQVIELESAPGEIARGLRPLVPRLRSGPPARKRACVQPGSGTLAGLSNSRPPAAASGVRTRMTAGGTCRIRTFRHELRARRDSNSRPSGSKPDALSN